MSIRNVNEVSTPFSLDPKACLQFMYAQMQLIQSEAMKDQAMEVMKDIEKALQEQEKTSNMLEKARQLHRQAGSGSDGMSEMPQEMMDFFRDPGRNLQLAREPYDPTRQTVGKGPEEKERKAESSFTRDGWEFNIRSLDGYRDRLGSDTQARIVFLQDFVSRYGSYLQGAGTQISSSADTRKTILPNS